MTGPGLLADACLKCNLCTAACPVAAVTDLFPGPKAVGPQWQRFRHPRLPSPDRSVAWCSGCGTCSRVCPQGVRVAEINIQAKEQLARKIGIPLRDQIIARPALMGLAAAPVAPLANLVLRFGAVRWVLERTLGISRHSPIPPFARRTLRSRLRTHIAQHPPDEADPSLPTVAYFHGCSANYFEPELGELAVRMLERLGCRVLIPPQKCCGLPLQSNALFEPARRYARFNLSALAPFAQKGFPIVGTSTSCTLALKHDYRAVLGLDEEEAHSVALATYDIFEFMTSRLQAYLDEVPLRPVDARALYHPPCQLRSHAIGAPAWQVLRRIPGLSLVLSDCECCGVAGTYGMKVEKAEVALAVGRSLFQQAKRMGASFIISDSETCRWWIAKHTGLPAYHPLEILARGVGVL